MVEFPSWVFAQLSDKLKMPHPAVVHAASLPRKTKELFGNWFSLWVDVGV